jgi:O-antigen ligase
MVTFYHPNVFGGFLFCGLLSSFYLYFTQDAAGKRRLFLSAIVFQMATLLLTFSRAALIAALGAIFFWLIFSAMRFKNTKSIKHLTLTLAAACSICLVLFYHPIAARGGIVNYNYTTQGADAERIMYQKIAWELFKERPLLGVGLNNFRLQSHRFFPEGKVLYSEVHNIYLLFAAETGILGLSCFLLFLFVLLKNAWACIRTQEGLFFFSLFSGFLFIGCCDFYFIGTSFGQIFFFGSAALLYVITEYSRNQDLCEPSSN